MPKRRTKDRGSKVRAGGHANRQKLNMIPGVFCLCIFNNRNAFHFGHAIPMLILFLSRSLSLPFSVCSHLESLCFHLVAKMFYVFHSIIILGYKKNNITSHQNSWAQEVPSIFFVFVFLFHLRHCFTFKSCWCFFFIIFKFVFLFVCFFFPRLSIFFFFVLSIPFLFV